MKAYRFVSELPKVTKDTAVSELNTLFAGEESLDLVVTPDVTITMDAAFDASSVKLRSTGDIHLAADTQPSAEELAKLDCSDVKGGLLRSWLTPGVVGFNFRSANGSDVSGALATTDNWIHDNNSANGTSTELFADGLSTLTWASANTWSCSGSTIISGYLDDGPKNGHGAEVHLTNVPYTTYDVIVYCSSDSNPGQFLAKTVNGKTYTWDPAAGAAVEGSSVWGKAALTTPAYGVNTLRIKDLSGPLTIYGNVRSGSNRGGIAAIQIMPPSAPDNIKTYTLTLDGTATTWSGGVWTLNGESATAQTSGYVEIVATASTALTVDGAVSLTGLKFVGGEGIVTTIAIGDGGSMYSMSATVESGVLQQGGDNALGTTPTVVVEDGATFDMNGHAVSSSSAFYINGAGAGDWPWALTSSSGAGGAILGGLYLTDNATIGGANELKIGQTQAGYNCYLQGFTLTKTGSGALTGTNMNTPGTGTIDVQGGDMSVNQWNNLNNAGGDTTVILNAGTSLNNGTDRIVPMGTLKLLGGTLSTASRAFKVNTLLAGSGETANFAFADGASASLTGDFTVTSALTLEGAVSFLKDETAGGDVVVDIPGTLTASGTITVGPGVTLNLRTNRPTTQLTVSDGATLAVQLQSDFDVVSLNVSSRPSLVVYDAEGEVVENPNVLYENNTLVIMSGLPTLPVAAGSLASFETDWLAPIRPVDGGGAIIEIFSDSEHSGTAEIMVDGDYFLEGLTISGEGEVFFTGDGSLTVTNIYVKNGATLVHDAGLLSADAIELDSGTVLKIDGITETAAISGAGAVETYGTVVMAAVNSMTGGIAVKPGSSLSTSVVPVWKDASAKDACNSGFGPYNKDWACSALSSVVVEDGGCVDINNVASEDAGVALTIAGKGILNDGVYSGAVMYSGSAARGSNKRQISSLSLTKDAIVDVGVGWGLVHADHGAAHLALAGHTLTIRGTGTVPMVNVNASESTGTLIIDGATLELSNAASNFSGVDIILNGCTSVNFTTAPSALGSLTVKPTIDGTTASAWNLPSSITSVVNTVNVDSTGLTAGELITLLTVPTSVTLSGDNISVVASGRYDPEPIISENKVKVRVKDPTPFLHYDFNNGAAADTGAASDSGTTISGFGEASSVTLVKSRNGQAVHVHTGYTPYWGSYESDVSPFLSGEATVTGVFKLRETGVVLWGLGGAADSKAFGVVATSANSLAVVAKGSSGVETLVTVENTADLSSGWHFFAVVASADGTALYVDGLSASSDKVIPSGIGQQGQLGSFHGGAIGGSKVGNAGYLLDDWRVYDAALTENEVRELRRKVNPPPFRLMIR